MKPQQRYTEIEAREQAATKGPWKFLEHSGKAFTHGECSLVAGDGEWIVSGYGYDASGLDVNDNDKPFIEHSRADIPYLLARVRRAAN